MDNPNTTLEFPDVFTPKSISRIKPTLVGGDDPPRNFRHKVFTLSNHHLYVLSILSQHLDIPDGRLLGNIIQFFIESNRDLVDGVFKARGIHSKKNLGGAYE